MIVTDPDRWYYIGEHCSTYTDKLVAGDIVVHDRQPYRIVEIASRPHINWNAKYLAMWEESDRPDPETWWRRPFVIVWKPEALQPGDGPGKTQHVEAPGNAYWTVIPEHFAVCRLCGELPPCTDVHNERIMERASKRFAEDMKILPGHCHACQEFVTHRQGSIRFGGPNLIRPDLGNNSAIFHTRRQCFGDAFDYDKRWSAAEPGRPGKLSCPGSVTIHVDQTLECSLGPGCAGQTDVLGEPMRHRGGEERHHPAWQDRHGNTMPATDCWCTASVETLLDVLGKEAG